MRESPSQAFERRAAQLFDLVIRLALVEPELSSELVRLSTRREVVLEPGPLLCGERLEGHPGRVAWQITVCSA